MLLDYCYLTAGLLYLYCRNIVSLLLVYCIFTAGLSLPCCWIIVFLPLDHFFFTVTLWHNNVLNNFDFRYLTFTGTGLRGNVSNYLCNFS